MSLINIKPSEYHLNYNRNLNFTNNDNNNSNSCIKSYGENRIYHSFEEPQRELFWKVYINRSNNNEVIQNMSSNNVFVRGEDRMNLDSLQIEQHIFCSKSNHLHTNNICNISQQLFYNENESQESMRYLGNSKENFEEYYENTFDADIKLYPKKKNQKLIPKLDGFFKSVSSKYKRYDDHDVSNILNSLDERIDNGLLKSRKRYEENHEDIVYVNNTKRENKGKFKQFIFRYIIH